MGGGGCGNCCIGKAVKDVFKNIFGCRSDCCVGVGVPHNRDDEQHVRKAANELAEMKEKMEKSSSERETKIMEYINRSMNSFLRELTELNEQSFNGESLNINVQAIKEKNSALSNQVIGCIGNVMNTRLVQTDKELNTILEERDDKKRKTNFESYVNKLEKEAIAKLKKEVERSVREQSALVSAEINGRLKEVNSRLEESIEELTSIMEVKNRSDRELEEKQLGYMYQSSLCDFLLNEVEG